MGQMKKQLFLSISCKQSEGNDIMKEIFGECTAAAEAAAS
jgi:hypothetical protein